MNNDPPNYEKRVRKLEREGLTRSDAQGVVMAEDMKRNVSAQTADAMHATITQLMRENASLRKALVKWDTFMVNNYTPADISWWHETRALITRSK